MGSKKRGPSAIEETTVVDGENADQNIDSKNNLKKGKGIERKTKGENDAPSTSIPSSSMERRKKRKMLDKERHRVSSESNETKPSQEMTVMNTEDSARTGYSNDQPVFHISVFGELASVDAPKREAAAEQLALELLEVQNAYERVGDKDDGQCEFQLEAAKDDGLDNCAPSVRYAVRRLIRGVSSSRECARQGFALGLTILVCKISKIKLDSVLKLIVDSLEVSSSMKGQEVKDCLLGRLFAYCSLARSGRLEEAWDLDKNSPYIREFTNLLITLASKKRYLQEPAVAVLLDLIEKLPKEAVTYHILSALGLGEWFEKATDVGNPDALLLALKIQQKVGTDSSVFGNLLPQSFSPSRFFTVDHLTKVANCLKESTFCQPRVHGIWPYLVNLVLPDTILLDASSSSSLSSTRKNKKSRRSSSTDEDTAECLRCFCEVILENSLLSSSHDRKHLAFDVLLLMLPRLPASHVPIVLSHKFVQGLMDILSTKDSWLHKVAEHFLKELLDWASSDDIRRVFVVVALQKHSRGRFDSITRTKTIKDLMAGFTTESGCMLLMQKLTSMFVDEDHVSDEPSDQSQTTDDNSEIGSVDKESAERSGSIDLSKSWIVESLPNILKHLKLDSEAKYRVQKEMMKFLAVQGLFSASLGTEVTSFELQEKFKWPKTPISSALCKMCIDQLQLLLSNAQKAEGPHSLTNSLEANDLSCYFMRFLGTLCTIPSVSFVRPLSIEDEKAFKKLQDMESRLSKEERNYGLSMDANKIHALRHLLIQLLLQLLLRPGEYTEAASELIICCRKAFPAHHLLESSGEDESEEDGSPELMDVLVDTLLSLLPQSSAPLRSAVEQVFRYFCNDVTCDGLLRMLRVIKKDLKPARRKDADSEDGSDDDDLLDIEETEESDGVEAIETGGLVDDSEAVNRADASEEGEETSDASDEDDDSDDNMDDEAMFRMDSYLAKIFQERKNQTGGDSTHAQLVLFKLRVLSLLEIYLHENPASSKVLTIYSNLVQALVNPSTTEGSEQLAQRIWGILQKKIFRGKEYPKSKDLELTVLESLLEKSLRLAARPFRKKKTSGTQPQKKQSISFNRYKMINSLAQQSTYWLLKVIEGQKFPESELTRVFEIFKAALVKYFESKKSQLKPEFLKEVMKRRPWVGREIFGFLVEKCGDAKSDYRRVEALELVSEILKSLLTESTPEGLKSVVKGHISKLSHLIKQLVKNMPEKQSRRAEVRKFCGKVFQIISTYNLNKSFLKTLEQDDIAACESQLGEPFLALKKTGK